MKEHALPIVALVGQPNVGKSSLLNVIAGQKFAVTSGVPGTTRDRQYVDVAWNGQAFTVVDTAGLSSSTDGELELNVNRQIDVAIKEADLIAVVVDGREPVAQLEEENLRRFRRIKKPLVLAVNKLDGEAARERELPKFLRLGIKPAFAVSAVSGRGLGDLLDHIAGQLPKKDAVPQAEEDARIAVCLVGKPNVGKSSLFNRILKQERAVVSPIPGTTRTAVDSHATVAGHRFTFIDTAGLKKKEYRQETPDIYSGFQTFKAIRRSDVAVLVLDATDTITVQDQRIAREIFDQKKGCLIAVTKCDAFQGDQGKLRDYVSHHFPFLWMCPVFFVSGKTGAGIQETIPAMVDIHRRRQKTIDDQALTEFLQRKLKANPPKLLRDQKKPKVFSLQQTGVNPPSFMLTVNHPAAISQQFRKFVENGIIRELDFWGTPVALRLAGKDKA